MSNAGITWICLLLVVFIPAIDSSLTELRYRANGGSDCATCSIFLGLIDHLTIVHNESAAKSLDRLCDFLPDPYKRYCKTAVDFLGPFIIDGFIKGDNPDVICHGLKFCKDDPGQPKCRIYPSKSSSLFSQRVSELVKVNPMINDVTADPKICEIPGIKEICKIFDNVFNNHVPLVDLDGDRFGEEQTFRGSSWRGKDCNDLSSQIHPGVRSIQGDAIFDHNCNGIMGLDPSTGKPYEELFCNDTQRLGIAVLGESMSAHYHIPEEWLDAREFSRNAFEHLGFIIENELDWPQMSATTGHLNVSWPNIIGPTRSLYLRLFDLDHCNHRDYQNIAVNGAYSRTMLGIMKSLSRNQKDDTPLLVIYSLVGDDVCNSFPDTIDHMTTVEEMHQNVITTLTYLDTILPKGSHVLTTGLGNGSYLYEILHERLHPFGRVGPPVTYPMFYDYLSCLQISPCNGWLTSNATLRSFTTEHASKLSKAVQNASFTYQPQHFDIDYIDFPFDEVMQQWIAQGGQPWQLIEGVDGFHMNQYGQALTSDIIWKWLQKEKPQWIPPLNPHNADIERIFKDQGGYI